MTNCLTTLQAIGWKCIDYLAIGIVICVLFGHVFSLVFGAICICAMILDLL